MRLTEFELEQLRKARLEAKRAFERWLEHEKVVEREWQKALLAAKQWSPCRRCWRPDA